MRRLKGVLFVLAGLFVMITLISLLMPSRVMVTRAESMHGDSMKIFREISDLRKWKDWQPVFINDSAGITFSDVSDTVNSTAEWVTNGKKNKLVITEKKYPIVKVLVQREGDNDVENILSLMPVQEPGSMQVQWEAVTKLHWYPWEKFGAIFMDKMTGPGYESALKNLQQYIDGHQ